MSPEVRRRFTELKAGGGLPSPQGVALAIARMASREDVGTEPLVRLVKSDPAMAGRLLRAANAAQGGSRRHIVSLAQAVVFLGLYRVRQLALAFSLVDGYRRGRCAAFDYPAYWAQSLATAVGAQELARFAQVPREESFTCGLLAGIGRLGLATAFPEDYARILVGVVNVRGDEAMLLAREAEAFGVDHAALSSDMLADWGLPSIFADAVRYHESPDASPFPAGSRVDTLARMLHLAAAAARALVSGKGSAAAPDPQMLYHAAAQLGLEATELAPTIERIVGAWTEWGRELRLPTAHPPIDELLDEPPPMSSPPEDALLVTPLRVGLIGDDTAALASQQAWLARLGQETVVAGAWPASSDQLVKVRPDVLLVDVREGTRAGRSVLQAIRNVEAPHHSFMIALILASDEANVADLIRAGADDYLCWPPVDSNVLEARLHAAQRVVALQSAVRSEREAAIRHSSAWARSSRRLLHDALTDPLTELPNRRFGMDHLTQEFAFAAETGQPLACLMLDIDHFKQVNDTWGHDTGDRVLRRVAAIILANSRRNDVVFRFGGEEFCIVCPATGGDEARGLAERILAEVRSVEFDASGKAFRLTVSAGVAPRSEATSTPEKLLAAADSALYRAKVGGRDRVVIA